MSGNAGWKNSTLIALNEEQEDVQYPGDRQMGGRKEQRLFCKNYTVVELNLRDPEPVFG